MSLLLQTSCVGETLWAYNSRHLDFLTGYVAATIRERSANTNSTMASRLPKLLKVAQNRRAVLQAIEALRVELSRATR